MTMMLGTLDELYMNQLRDLYSAETQLTQALPKMAQAATSPALREAFETHLQQTQKHVQRLEQIFNQIGGNPNGHTCEAMEGLISEGDEVVEASGPAAVKDAALIAAAQRVEHYEIASYGTARTIANQLGQEEHADLLQKTLDEEGQTDKNLTALAEGNIMKDGINAEAAGA